MDEILHDLSVDPDGTVRVVWAQPDGLAPATNDVYTISFQLPGGSYRICPLFDQSRSYRLKSTVPIKLQLCDAQGQNRSSPALVLTATELVKQDSTASSAVVEDTGNANPDSNFRYDEALQGYVFNLGSKNLSPGTWELRFAVTGDPKTYSVTFDLR